MFPGLSCCQGANVFIKSSNSIVSSKYEFIQNAVKLDVFVSAIEMLE